MGVIYKITNMINNKIYIGQTIRTESERWQGHIWHAYNDPENDSIALCHAIKKYGSENFKREILAYCDSVEELNNQEIKYILQYNSTNPDIGYNISLGGGGHTKYDMQEVIKLYDECHSIVSVAKQLGANKQTISKQLRGAGINTYNCTVLQYNISGDLITTFNSFSDARRQLVDLHLPKLVPPHHYCQGYFWVYETDNVDINTIIANYKNNDKITKAIEQYDTYGHLLNTYASAAEAARLTKIGVSVIKAAASGRQVSAGGYLWHRVNGPLNFDDQYANFLLSSSCCAIEEINDQNEVIGTYSSAGAFEKLMNWSYQCVKMVCDGKRTSTHGRVFRYAHPDKRKLIMEQNQDK